MRKSLLALSFPVVLAACEQFQPEQPPPLSDNVLDQLPAEFQEQLATALGDAEYRVLLDGRFEDLTSPEGFIRITDIDCQAIERILENPDVDIEGIRPFLERLIVDGNAEAGENPRIIGVCGNDSFDAGLS